ncbi:hypothetical protein OIE52_45920 [Streptomyces canus]|uniref:hypothetical protein n=1 Tax=Streptomyces canus TaxID=58343 RepID=UPI0032467939
MNADVLRAAYEAFAGVVRPLGDEESWRPTGCAVGRQAAHRLCGARPGLPLCRGRPAGPGSPAHARGRTARPGRRDLLRDWAPDPAGAANGRRWNRVSAGMFLDFRQLRDLYLETTAATVNAAADARPDLRVATPGHVLTAGDLMLTLAVEATVHHLALSTDLPEAVGPSPAGLAAVRATLDGLLGRPVPLDWSDEHYARAATGPTPLTDRERLVLGADADRFPLFN